MITTEPVPIWNPYASEWETVTVEVTQPEPRRRRASRRRGHRRGAPRAPLDHTGGAPLDPYWVDTAFSETGPLADMRTWIKPAVLQAHRAAVVMPADPGRVTGDRLDV